MTNEQIEAAADELENSGLLAQILSPHGEYLVGVAKQRVVVILRRHFCQPVEELPDGELPLIDGRRPYITASSFSGHDGEWFIGTIDGWSLHCDGEWRSVGIAYWPTKAAAEQFIREVAGRGQLEVRP
jgi:hypothetical protein